MGQCKLALQSLTAAPGKRVALLTLDLDRFKLVNDSLGHGAGDVLLTNVGKRLRACVRDDDTLARIGGDEFAFLVEGLDAPGLHDLARRILEETRRPFWFGRRVVVCTCSLGAAWMDADYSTAEQALRDADLAMYSAKRDEPGQYWVFEESMRQGEWDALDLLGDLTGAVGRGEFVVHYQPICNAQTQYITGVEALVRWQHPKRGLLGPDTFIAAAEERGLIRDIGRFVLETGSAQLRRWREQFPGLDLVLHVNLSAAELKNPELAGHISGVLASSGIEPSALQLEITERIFLGQREQAETILSAIRQSGVRIALDDFGTGFCSLGYLEQYEVDTIKVDRSFVVRLTERARTRAVVAAIVQLADAMGVDVVAEGVEDPAQLRALTEIGCRQVQGFLLGRPVDPSAVTTALRQQAYLVT